MESILPQIWKNKMGLHLLAKKINKTKTRQNPTVTILNAFFDSLDFKKENTRKCILVIVEAKVATKILWLRLDLLTSSVVLASQPPPCLFPCL